MVVNYYDKIGKEYLNDAYHNPNKCKGVPLHPFRLLLIGAAGAGKSNGVINVTVDCNAFERIYLFAKETDQPLYRWLIDKISQAEDKVKTKILTYSSEVNDIPAPEEFDKNKQNLVIIDDMIGEDNKGLLKVAELYTRGRHRSISVCFLSQSFFDIPKIIRKNTGYILLRGVEDKNDFKLIAGKYAPNKTPEELYKMYLNATSKPLVWFMIDLTTTDPKMKFRSGWNPINGPSSEERKQALARLFMK